MFTQLANMLENELAPPSLFISIPTVSVSTLWIGEQTVGLIRGNEFKCVITKDKNTGLSPNIKLIPLSTDITFFEA